MKSPSGCPNSFDLSEYEHGIPERGWGGPMRLRPGVMLVVNPLVSVGCGSVWLLGIGLIWKHPADPWSHLQSLDPGATLCCVCWVIGSTCRHWRDAGHIAKQLHEYRDPGFPIRTQHFDKMCQCYSFYLWAVLILWLIGVYIYCCFFPWSRCSRWAP